LVKCDQLHACCKNIEACKIKQPDWEKKKSLIDGIYHMTEQSLLVYLTTEYTILS